MLPIRPQPLRPGDRVRIVAPSGPFDRTLVLRGLAFLGERYHVEFDRGLFAQQGFLAGSDARRLAELDAALREPGVRAVVAARGGYGLGRIAHQACWAALAEAPRWLVGFSDVTALHVEAWHLGVGSLHAHNVAGLGRGDAPARAAWLSAVEAPRAAARHEALAVWHGGTARGPLVGGNLTLLHSTAASGRLVLPPGCVLFIEDVGEQPYRIDRMISSLLVAGALDRVAAVVVGEMVDCLPGRHGVPVEDVLRERLGQLRVPVLSGLPVGHGKRNDPLELGAIATVDAPRGTLEIGGT